MARQQSLFVKPRRVKSRRVIMHMTDAGQADGMMPGWRTPQGARFVCGKCGHDDGWTFNLTMTEIKRGLPCPKCNSPTRKGEPHA